MSLQEQLRAYYQLDQRVHSMRSRLDAAINRQAVQQRKQAQLEQQLAELTTQHKQHQAHALSLESESSGLASKINALRDRMNSVTNNKEYSALLVEVNTGKIEQSKLEEEALAAMTKAEELANDVEALQARVKEQTQLVEGSSQEVDEARKEIGAELESLTAERDAAAEPLPPAAKKQYDRLSHVHDGEAMAGIAEQNKRRMEYTCEGCYTIIPVEIVNALITRPDDVISCKSCERILFVPEDIREDLGAAKS